MRISRVSKRYGDVRAVEGMTWTAPSGRITAVLGPNGAGKTTTMECLEGLIEPTSGEVEVLGRDPWNAGPEHRAEVGVMLQDGGLPNGTTPLRLLRHLASFYVAPLPVADLVRDLGIDAFGGTTIRRLSGGQRQRVALAAALIGDPQVLFLDEPTAGLDPHARLDVWQLIAAARERGKTVVVTTHSFEEAERLADRIVIIHRGAVAAAGTVDEIRGVRSLEDVYFELTAKAGR